MNIGSFNLEGYIPDSSTSRKTLTPEIHHRTKPYNPSLYSSSENISALAEEEDRLPNEVAGTREPAMDKESTFQIKTNVPRETVDSRRESPTEQLQREIDELLRGHERLSDQIVK